MSCVSKHEIHFELENNRKRLVITSRRARLISSTKGSGKPSEFPWSGKHHPFLRRDGQQNWENAWLWLLIRLVRTENTTSISHCLKITQREKKRILLRIDLTNANFSIGAFILGVLRKYARQGICDHCTVLTVLAQQILDVQGTFTICLSLTLPPPLAREELFETHNLWHHKKLLEFHRVQLGGTTNFPPFFKNFSNPDLVFHLFQFDSRETLIIDWKKTETFSSTVVLFVLTGDRSIPHAPSERANYELSTALFVTSRTNFFSEKKELFSLPSYTTKLMVRSHRPLKT